MHSSLAKVLCPWFWPVTEIQTPFFFFYLFFSFFLSLFLLMCSACYSSCLGCSGANSSQCTSCNPTSPTAAYFDDGSCVNRCNTLSFSPSGSYICQGMTLVLCDFVLCGMTSVLCDFVFEDCSCNDLAVDCTDVGVCGLLQQHERKSLWTVCLWLLPHLQFSFWRMHRFETLKIFFSSSFSFLNQLVFISFLECSCNQLSSTCDTTTGVCINCLGNSAGDHCESCLPGFAKSLSGLGCGEFSTLVGFYYSLKKHRAKQSKSNTP